MSAITSVRTVFLDRPGRTISLIALATNVVEIGFPRRAEGHEFTSAEWFDSRFCKWRCKVGGVSGPVTGSASDVPGSLRVDRSTYHYRHRRPEQASRRKRIRELSGPASYTVIGASTSGCEGRMDHQPQAHPASVSRGGPALAKKNPVAESVGKAARGSRRGYSRQ